MKKSPPNYAAWDVRESDFPKSGSMSQQIAFLAQYGSLAASTHNTQPWLFDLTDTKLTIRPNLDLLLPEADPSERNLWITLGACAANIEVAAARFDIGVEVRTSGNEIFLNFTNKPPKAGYKDLFPALTQRYSDKRALPSRPLPEGLIEKLAKGLPRDVEVSFNENTKDIHKLASSYFAAASSYASSKSFARELSQWLAGNKTKRLDGMPGFVSGLSNPKAIIGKFLLRLNPKFVKVLAKKYLDLILNSPALGVISTDESKESWVKTGYSYELMALKAILHSVSLTPLAAMVERPESRSMITKYFNTGNPPQLFFRLVNVASDRFHTPRRTIAAELNLAALTGVSLKHVTLGSHTLRYAEAGEGDPIVLIHGANMGWGQWHPNIPVLAKHFKVIAIDLPGCGASSRYDYRALDFTKDYVASVGQLIQHLGLKDPVLVGHSLGGAIVLKLIAMGEVRVSKALLVDPLGFSARIAPKQLIVSIYPAVRLLTKTALEPTLKNMDQFLRSALKKTASLRQEFVDYYYEAVSRDLRSHPLLLMNSLSERFKIKSQVVLSRQELSGIHAHTLLVLGAHDKLVPVKDVEKKSKQLPKAEVRWFADSGHVPSLEEPDLFNKTLIEFIKQP